MEKSHLRYLTFSLINFMAFMMVLLSGSGNDVLGLFLLAIPGITCVICFYSGMKGFLVADIENE